MQFGSKRFIGDIDARYRRAYFSRPIFAELRVDLKIRTMAPVQNWKLIKIDLLPLVANCSMIQFELDGYHGNHEITTVAN